jgi:hypothetical protein
MCHCKLVRTKLNPAASQYAAVCAGRHRAQGHPPEAKWYKAPTLRARTADLRYRSLTGTSQTDPRIGITSRADNWPFRYGPDHARYARVRRTRR